MQRLPSIDQPNQTIEQNLHSQPYYYDKISIEKANEVLKLVKKVNCPSFYYIKKKQFLITLS